MLEGIPVNRALRACALGFGYSAEALFFLHIVIEWDGYSGRTSVEWKFAPQTDGTTFVSIAESGWTGDADELVKYVSNSTQGFTWTLAGLKACALNWQGSGGE